MKGITRFNLIVAMVLLANSITVSAKDASEALEELLGTLRDNGTITQEQYDQLIRGLGDKGDVAEMDRKAIKTDREVELKASERVQDTYTTDHLSLEIGGELMIDSAFYKKDKNDLGNGTEIRRARLKAAGNIYDWTYELGVDFAGGDADIKDAYFGYEGWSSTSLIIGQYKEPFSLEELTSAKYITFMERALPIAFAPGRNIGIGVHNYWDTVTIAGGLFGESYDTDVDDEGDEGWGVAGRLTYSPIHKKTRALHFGAATEYRKPNDDRETKYETKPESDVTDVKYVNTGKIKDVDSTAKYGLEAAGIWGPFSGQAEYIFTDVSRRSGAQDLNLDGWYAYGSWFLTGESRNYRYKNGNFGLIKPLHRYGAWELATRYSMIDLTDGLIAGGKEHNITLGLNWYINPYIRVMANYIKINNNEDADDNGDVIGSDDPSAFQLRLQGVF